MPHVGGRTWLAIEPIPVQLVAIVRLCADAAVEAWPAQLHLSLLGGLLIDHLIGAKAAVDEDATRRSVEPGARLREAVLRRDIAVGVATEIRVAVMRYLLRRRVIRRDAAQMMIVILVVQCTQIRHGIAE